MLGTESKQQSYYHNNLGLRPALSLQSCVIWGKILNLPEPLCSHTKISM